MQIYHSKQKSPAAFSSVSLLEWNTRFTRFAQWWLKSSYRWFRTFPPIRAPTGLNTPAQLPRDSPALSTVRDLVSDPWGQQSLLQWCCSRVSLQLPTGVSCAGYGSHQATCGTTSQCSLHLFPGRCSMMGPGATTGDPSAALLLTGALGWAPQVHGTWPWGIRASLLCLPLLFLEHLLFSKKLWNAKPVFVLVVRTYWGLAPSVPVWCLKGIFLISGLPWLTWKTFRNHFHIFCINRLRL